MTKINEFRDWMADMSVATLFDETPPYQPHSRTSIEAARSVVGRTSGPREAIYGLLRRFQLTDEQIAERLGMNPSTERPRRIELAKAGRIIPVGESLTTSGRKAVVWAASEEAGA